MSHWEENLFQSNSLKGLYLFSGRLDQSNLTSAEDDRSTDDGREKLKGRKVGIFKQIAIDMRINT